MRSIVAVLLVLSALPLSPIARAAETVLHLNQTISMVVPPDELLMMLRAETLSPNPAEAQSRLNALARSAATLAEPVKEVRFATVGYQVNRAVPAPNERGGGQWRATQSFRLTSADPAALLTLAGALQQKGLTVTAMQWRLAPDTERKARQAATRDLLRTLRDRTADAALALDMTFSHFRSVQLDGDDAAPAPRAGPMMGRAMEVSGVVGVQEDIVVMATAQVEAVLVSR